MSKGLLFWILMLLAVVVWGVGVFGGPYYAHYGTYGTGFLSFSLFAILGWTVYGPPVR